MKRFLGATWSPDGSVIVAVHDSATGALQSDRSRTSPLFPARPDGSPAELGDHGVIAFLVPRSPTATLANLVNDQPIDVQNRTYITHGHASAVVLVDDMTQAEAVVDSVGDLLLGYELWPYVDSRVDRDDIVVVEPVPAEWGCPEEVSTDGLGFEAAAQVRQFNANLAFLTHIARRQAPELQELVVSIAESVSDIAELVRELLDGDDIPDQQIRQAINLESSIVELNAVVTLYCSQVASGSLPIHQSSFPVGEYSLLGIGGMARAAWRIYAHINNVFASFDHIGLVQRLFRGAEGFDPYGPTRRVSYQAWEDAPASFSTLRDGVVESARMHIPYFSSRWGFHEALHSISVSWQCLHASATKEWNLLTLTHEFLHSHVRELLGEITDFGDDPTAFEATIARYNARQQGTNALQSMQLGFIEALVGIRGVERLSRRLVPGGKEPEKAEVPATLTPAQVIELARDHSGLVHEIIVHVLDFMYVYNKNSDDYVNSIWSSWSLVPSVNEHIELYVLRTLCALSIVAENDEPAALFDEITSQLATSLAPLANRERTRPAIHRALAVLTDDDSRRRLDLQFRGARYVAKLAQYFLFDLKLNAELIRDANTTVQEGSRTYALGVGEYRGEEIQSPVGFLLDRFGSYSDQAGSTEAEYESIWQLLQLI